LETMANFKQNNTLILASSSPRRQALLLEACYSIIVQEPSDFAEDQHQKGESAEDFVKRQAIQKTEDVARRNSSGVILGCDTVACFQDAILGKPNDRDHAQQILETLRGHQHTVLSGICLWHRPSNRTIVRCIETTLFFDNVSDDALQQYLATNKWQGKAGAFGYQDGWDWLHIVHGSPSNVVGLPLEALTEMLADIETR
ncbi:MAG: Maf family protein, partial [Pirellulales bacterium]|jgi:septum formation protein